MKSKIYGSWRKLCEIILCGRSNLWLYVVFSFHVEVAEEGKLVFINQLARETEIVVQYHLSVSQLDGLIWANL